MSARITDLVTSVKCSPKNSKEAHLFRLATRQRAVRMMLLKKEIVLT